MPKFKMWTFTPERGIFLYKELCHSVKIYFKKFQSSYLQPMTSQKKIRFLFVIKFTTEKILVQTACLNVTTYCIHSLARSISRLSLPLVLRRMFKNLLPYMVCSKQSPLFPVTGEEWPAVTPPCFWKACPPRLVPAWILKFDTERKITLSKQVAREGNGCFNESFRGSKAFEGQHRCLVTKARVSQSSPSHPLSHPMRVEQ